MDFGWLHDSFIFIFEFMSYDYLLAFTMLNDILWNDFLVCAIITDYEVLFMTSTKH